MCNIGIQERVEQEQEGVAAVISSGQEAMGGQGVVLPDVPEGRLTQLSIQEFLLTRGRCLSGSEDMPKL